MRVYGPWGTEHLLVVASDAPAWLRSRVPSGRLCDGTQDEDQIQAALDEAAASGGMPVHLSPGTFSIRRSIDFPDSDETGVQWALRGAGIGITTLKRAALSWGPILRPVAENCDRLDADVCDLDFDGNVENVVATPTFLPGAINVGSDEITVNDHPYATGDQVYWDSTGALPTVAGDALASETPYYVAVVDVNTITLHRSAAGAEATPPTDQINFTGTGGGTHSLGHMEVRNNPLVKANRTNWTLRRVSIHDWLGYGLYDACLRHTFEDASILRCKGGGVYGVGVGGSLYEGLTIQGCGEDSGRAIHYTRNAWPLRVKNCQISYQGSANNLEPAIYTNDRRCYIESCDFYGNAAEAIQLAGSADDCRIVNSRFRANTLMGTNADIYISGSPSGAVIRGNTFDAAPLVTTGLTSIVNGESVASADLDVGDSVPMVAGTVTFAEGANRSGVVVSAKPSAGWTGTIRVYGYSYSRRDLCYCDMSWAGGNAREHCALTFYQVTDVVLYARTGAAAGVTIDVGNYSAPTTYGIESQTGETPDDAAIADNLFVSQNTSPIHNMTNFTGATVILNNRGLVTQNSGTDTIAAGAASAVITHGLGYTPRAQDIRVIPTATWGNAKVWYVDTITDTQFTVNVDVAPGGAGAAFTWEVTRHSS